MRNGDIFANIVRPLIITAILFLAFPGTLLSAGIRDGSPAPDDAGKEDAARFNTTAKTVLAPAYPYLAEYIVERFDLGKGQGTGIDIGGGTGDLVRELCSRAPGYYWLNTDLNPHYAGYFYKGLLEGKLAGRAGFLQADVHHLPFRDNYADIVVSRGSLQQWKNREKAFGEILRVLKPGGRAMIGRGFSENMPLETAAQVRKKQGGGPRYSPGDTAVELEGIMKNLGIPDYEVLRPRTDQDQVNYGVWIVFSKPGQ